MSPVPRAPALRRILVVEDAPGCADTLDAALHSMDCVSLTFAGSAEEAIGALSKSVFAALITDVNLPGMDGLELVSRLRAMPQWKSTAVLVISADPDPDLHARALAAGADAFFPKPFSPSAVRRTLEDLLHEK